MRNRTFQFALIVLLALLLGGAWLQVNTWGQDVKEAKEEQSLSVDLYRDMDGKEKLSEVERHYTPESRQPLARANDMSVNLKYAAKKLDPKATGTCIQAYFKLEANQWASMVWVPSGGDPGTVAGLNIAKKLLVGGGRPVFLKFRARTSDNKKLKVRFGSCGWQDGDHCDGVKLVQVPAPEVTQIDDRWRDVSIDLTRKADGLSHVVSPFRITVREMDNPGVEDYEVFVDDIRFEVGPPKRK